MDQKEVIRTIRFDTKNAKKIEIIEYYEVLLPERVVTNRVEKYEILGCTLNRELLISMGQLQFAPLENLFRAFLDACVDNKRLLRFDMLSYIQHLLIQFDLFDIKKTVTPANITKEEYNEYIIKQKNLGLDTLRYLVNKYGNNLEFETRYNLNAQCFLSGTIATIYHAIENNYQLNKCELCGRYFFPDSRADERFCDFESMEYIGKSCKEANELLQKKRYLQQNELQKVKKRVRSLIYSRNNGDCTCPEMCFFIEGCADWKERIAQGTETEANFLMWLNKFYIKKGKA